MKYDRSAVVSGCPSRFNFLNMTLLHYLAADIKVQKKWMHLDAVSNSWDKMITQQVLFNPPGSVELAWSLQYERKFSSQRDASRPTWSMSTFAKSCLHIATPSMCNRSPSRTVGIILISVLQLISLKRNIQTLPGGSSTQLLLVERSSLRSQPIRKAKNVHWWKYYSRKDSLSQICDVIFWYYKWLRSLVRWHLNSQGVAIRSYLLRQEYPS